MSRSDKLYKKFVEEYGEELEEAVELIDALLAEVPEASDVEFVEFVIQTVTDNEDDFLDEIEDAVIEFQTFWGVKN